jgi:uncharacterized oligopeptide transporter (OPT) family protein
MSILRTFFSNSSILENNLVQTGIALWARVALRRSYCYLAASAGEALAAGVIFTFPAVR